MHKPAPVCVGLADTPVLSLDDLQQCARVARKGVKLGLPVFSFPIDTLLYRTLNEAFKILRF